MTTPVNEPAEPGGGPADPGSQRPDQADDEPGGIDDEQLPEDLQPTDDNPLAKSPAEDGEESTQRPTGL